MDLQEAFDAGFVAVKAYVDDALEGQKRQIGEIVRAAVAQAVAELPAAKNGVDGLDGQPGAHGKDGAAGRDGVDGKDAEPITEAQIAEAVARHLEANPPAAGKDGRDGVDGKDGRDGVNGEKGMDGVPGRDGTDGAPGRDGVDGKDGRDGIDGEKGLDGSPGRDGVDGEAGQKGADGENGRDGCDATEAMIDRDGNLVVVFSDGRSKALGLVVGRDGKNGEKGDPGRDGLDLTGFDTELSEDGRFVTFRLENEAVKVAHQLELPTMIYRGVFQQGKEYRPGDTVSWGGGLWHCGAPTGEKPGDGSEGWALAVRRGRDGSGVSVSDVMPPIEAQLKEIESRLNVRLDMAFKRRGG